MGWRYHFFFPFCSEKPLLYQPVQPNSVFSYLSESFQEDMRSGHGQEDVEGGHVPVAPMSVLQVVAKDDHGSGACSGVCESRRCKQRPAAMLDHSWQVVAISERHGW